MIDLTFWGKAQPSNADPDAPGSHPLAYHSLDVAACAREILSARPRVRAAAARLLELDEDAAGELLVALIALHDLGKCAPKFQMKAPEHWPAALGPCDALGVHKGHHTKDGLTLWEAKLEAIARPRLWPGGGNALRALAPAIFGHHGYPVGAPNGPTASQALGRTGLSEALVHADAMLQLLHPEPLAANDLTMERAALASWWVAGLTTLADWVGSNQEWFPYVAPLNDDPTLTVYWALAGERAVRAVREAGLVAPRVAPLRQFSEIAGQASPTPTQRWAETTELPGGPLLAIIEDVTGAGKTEAAQMLVHRLMSDGRASGAYWAMPTQATANAMYARQRELFAALYEPCGDRLPSLVLAHGQQRLHPGFRATVLGLSGTGQAAKAAGTAQDEDMPSSASCTAFLADDRRVALLADIGAGTVDQALLGVLPSRFNTLRLFALADKVLVIDEAHAFDAYMGVEVQELLRFHVALGGSAVVLSATLSSEQRERMVAAWMDGTNGGRRLGAGASRTKSVEYPLATVVSGGDVPVREEALQAASWSHRTVRVRMVHSVDGAVEHVVAEHGRGAAVAWVRNTVDDCLAAAEMLRARGVAPLIFHARFAQGDRQERERQVLALFGKGASREDRRGRVLVATQVIEQSLDLDFDAMVSDLAPIDFLVQRAGRLWRHAERDDERPLPEGERELVVLAPVFSEQPSSEWLGGPFAGTAYVYGNSGVLWRTVKVLSSELAIRTPQGMRALIGAVYDDDEVPDSLLAAAQRAEGKESAFAATANYATLKVSAGYDASQHGWLSDIRAPTRLGDEQTIVRLARVMPDGSLAPWIETESEPWKAWALSEVRLSRWKVPRGATAEPRYDAAIAAVRAGWGKWEQDRPVLPLVEASAGVFDGVLAAADSAAGRRLYYDQARGILFQPPEC